MKTAWMRRHRVWFGLAMLVLFVLPFLALIPLGMFWLFQQGWLLYWLGIAALLGLAAHLLLRQLQPAEPGSEAQTAAPATDSPPEPDWTPRDRAAWRSVQEVAAGAGPESITDRERMLQLARETIERVAAHYHPDDPRPIWNFTVPEALLLSERIAARLRRVTLDSVPAAHMVRVGQVVQLWEHRQLALKGARVARYLNRIWRVARTVDPLSAVLAETRDRVLRAALGEAGAWLRGRGTRIWVEEVGKAAIELYSGRLRADARQLQELAAADTGLDAVADGAMPGALRLLVAGQSQSGKSSLINVLLGEVAAPADVLPGTAEALGYRLQRPGAGEFQLIDTPGIGPGTDLADLAEQAFACDLIVWVVAAHRADRALDRAGLDAIRGHFAQHPERSLPPVLIVASHIDRLSPAREWSPPYDLERPAGAKAGSIREALLAIGDDLGVEPGDIVPMRVDTPAEAYNADLLWAVLQERLVHAGHSRLQRLHLRAGQRDWKKILDQAANAGRLLTRLATHRPPAS
ncbi:GTPase family protein [Thioalkalivibrio paradoxus]|uniref:GTPase family protein n=1 Tax=Thioalkalivibrio paradoxus TaxID=108010 RepID=UPI00022C157A|nr:GTPase domain-containing protein [Thioalkalivibrio paradoxus]